MFKWLILSLKNSLTRMKPVRRPVNYNYLESGLSRQEESKKQNYQQEESKKQIYQQEEQKKQIYQQGETKKQSLPQEQIKKLSFPQEEGKNQRYQPEISRREIMTESHSNPNLKM